MGKVFLRLGIIILYVRHFYIIFILYGCLWFMVGVGIDLKITDMTSYLSI